MKKRTLKLLLAKGTLVALNLFFTVSIYATTYYSQGSIAPNTTSNWNTVRAGGGTSPGNFSSGDVFVIQNGHNMTTSATWSVSGTNSKIWIESGGQLTASFSVTVSTNTTFQIDANGTYIHNNKGTPSSTIFQGTESFDAASNFEIQDWINNTTNIPIPSSAFGNLTINVASLAGNWNQTGNLSNVAGNLTIKATGGGTLEFRLTGNTALTLNIGGNLVISGGTLNLASGTGAPTLNIAGNYNQSSGTLTSSGSTSTINFSGSGKSFTQSSGTLTATNINWSVISGASITLNNAFTVAASRTLTVASSGSLSTSATITNNGTTTINGTFQLNSGGYAQSGTWTYGAAGSLIFNTNYTVASSHVYWPSSNGPFNVTVNSGASTLDFGNISRTIAGTFSVASAISNYCNLTLNGTIQLNSGYSFGSCSGGTLTYGCTSTLVYNSGGTPARAGEWGTGLTPGNVTISGNTTLNGNIGNGTICGTLTINPGSSLYMDYGSSGNSALTINKNLVLDGNLSLGFAFGGDMNLLGNFTNNGTFNANSRAVNFNGSSDQVISGTASTTLAYCHNTNTGGKVIVNTDNPLTISNDITIDAGATVKVNPTRGLTIAGTITNNAGATGILVASDVTGTASLISANSANATVQRYVTGTSGTPTAADWHLLASPVSDQTVASFVTNNPALAISGSICAIAPYNTAGHTYGTFYATTATDVLAAGSGYEMLRTANGPFSFQGALNAGSISTSITSDGDAYNLVGNPYSSFLAANSGAGATNFLDANSSLIETTAKAVYVWNPGTNDYMAINNASAATTLAPGQGFFVKATASGSLSFTQAMRTHTSGTFYKSAAADPATLALYADFGTKLSWTRIIVNENASLAMEPGLDAAVFGPKDSPELIYSAIAGNDNGFDIQSIAHSDLYQMNIPLGINATAGQTVSFRAEMSNMDPNATFFLLDNTNNAVTKLSAGETYSVQFANDYSGTGRFYLVSDLAFTGIEKPADGWKVWAADGRIYFNGTLSTHDRVSVYDLSGRLLAQMQPTAGRASSIAFNPAVSGTYLVKIDTANESISRKVVIVK